MPKTRFTGDVDIWTEGSKMRVGLSGGQLSAPVRLSAHLGTDVGQLLMSALIAGQLAALDLRGNATLSVHSDTSLTLHSREHQTNILVLDDQITVEAEEVDAVWRTSHLLTNVAAIIRALGGPRTVQAPDWMAVRLHLLLMGAARMGPSVMFEIAGCRAGERDGTLCIIQGERSRAEVLEALKSVALLPADVRPKTIVDAREVRPGENLKAADLIENAYLLHAPTDALALSSRTQTIDADARAVRGIYQGMRSTYPTVWLHSGAVRTGDGEVRLANIEEMQQLLDAANLIVPENISRYKLGAPDSDDPVVNLLREAGVPNPEWLAANIDAVRSETSPVGGHKSEPWHWAPNGR